MAWGGGVSNSKKSEDLWCLILRGESECCFELYGESPEARKSRHEGTLEPDKGIRFVRDFEREESDLINKLRASNDIEVFKSIMLIVSHEAASLESVKAAARVSNSSVS